MRRLLANGFVQQEMLALDVQMRQNNQLKQRRQKMSSRKRKDYLPRKNSGGGRVSNVTEELSSEWRRLKTCCGFVLENRELSALMLDLSSMNVCAEHSKIKQMEREQQEQKLSNQKSQWCQPEDVLVPKLATPTLKKHQLYLNRAMLSGDLQYANPIPAATAPCEAEDGKTAEVAAVVTALDLSEKLAEFSKGLVQQLVAAESNKFSDNSSDSGYEELSSVPEVSAGGF